MSQIDSTAPSVPRAFGLGRPSGLAERLQRGFFRSFFRLLVMFIGVAEWTCVAWVLRSLGVHPPIAVHVAAPVALYFVNRGVVILSARRPPRAVALALRGYAAVAFTSVFLTLFLSLAGIVWLAGWLAAQPVGAALAGMAPSSGFATSVAQGLARSYTVAVNAGMATIALLFLLGYTFGQRQLHISRVRVEVRDLPRELAGFTIAHISDLHIGQYLDLAELGRHVELVNSLAPDLICITGDLVDRAETCAAGFPVLAGLRARHGVLVTLGNHDFYAGADLVTAALRGLTPFTVLRDQTVELAIDGAPLRVIGVDDLGRDWARGVLEHPALAPLARHLPPGEPFVVLSHRPDCFRQSVALGASLMLSGHTHGGQLGLPSLLRRRTRNLAEIITEFDRGLFRIGSSSLYVNRGLGFTAQRIRLFTSREIALIELSAA
jgi:hypothetical protein